MNGNFAIDYFLTALASVYRNNSIGVILSGTASDGTLGLKAIKAEGGITFAQDSSAQFSSMPKNAYESGYADFILSPEGIAKELAQLATIPYAVLPSDKVEKNHSEKLNGDKDVLKRILSIVMSRTGIDFFSHYKQPSIYRRVVRRVALNKLATLSDYHIMLTNSKKKLMNCIMTFSSTSQTFFATRIFIKSLTKK